MSEDARKWLDVLLLRQSHQSGRFRQEANGAKTLWILLISIMIYNKFNVKRHFQSIIIFSLPFYTHRYVETPLR